MNPLGVSVAMSARLENAVLFPTKFLYLTENKQGLHASKVFLTVM